MAQLAAMFDKDPAVLAAHKLARERFEAWAANDASDPPPPDPIDAIQIALMRWERDRFGIQGSERHALGIIEETVETFLADDPTKTEEALDGLGDTCVYSAQLCTGNRLALAPILDLARVFTRRQHHGMIAHGVLAQVVLKGAQKIRGLDDVDRYRVRLVGAIAMCIAKAIDDVELMHDIAVKPGEVLLVVAREVLSRGEGHDAIPKPVPSEATRQMITPEEREHRKHERRAAAEAALSSAIAGYDASSDYPACLECGAELRTMGDADLWKCTANEEHVFTGKRVAAAGAETRVIPEAVDHRLSGARLREVEIDRDFDDSDTKPGG